MEPVAADTALNHVPRLRRHVAPAVQFVLVLDSYVALFFLTLHGHLLHDARRYSSVDDLHHGGRIEHHCTGIYAVADSNSGCNSVVAAQS